MKSTLEKFSATPEVRIWVEARRNWDVVISRKYSDGLVGKVSNLTPYVLEGTH